MYSSEADFLNLNLNFVRSDIDPTKVKPIETRDLVYLINDFLIRGTDMLNTFCTMHEERILELESRLDSFDRQLLLLERKLEDIPLDGVGLIPDVPDRTIRIENADSDSGEILKETVAESKCEEQPSTSNAELMKTESAGTVRVRDHHTFGKYFRMLKMGVPEPAVKQKMCNDNVDVDLLCEPDKLVPFIPVEMESEEELSGDSSFG